MSFRPPTVLIFDAGGTVFDWSTPIADEVAKAASVASRDALDPIAVALDCRGAFLSLNGAVIRGDRPWMDAENVFAEALAETLARHDIALQRRQLNEMAKAWRRMPAWPGSADAIAHLRTRYVVAPLTVLSLPMVLGSSSRAGVNWDCIFSCDLLGFYKPDPRCFARVAELLDVGAGDIMMVASHPSDLRGAKVAGWSTAYVRARLFDPDDDYEDRGFNREFDLVCENFEELIATLVP